MPSPLVLGHGFVVGWMVPQPLDHDLTLQFVLSRELRGGQRLNRPHRTAAHQSEPGTVHCMGALDWTKGCPDNWSTPLVGVSVSVSLEEIGTGLSR